MAATVDIHKFGGRFYVEIDETNVGLADEVTVQSDNRKWYVPPIGRIIRVVCVHTGGAVTTVNPILMLDAGGMAGPGVIYDKGGAIASVNQIQTPPATYFVSKAQYRRQPVLLYHRTRPGAAGSNFKTRYEIIPGWEQPV